MSVVTLQHTPAKIVQYLLIQLGLGVAPPTTPTTGVQNNWPTFAHRKVVNANKQQSNPSNAIIVYGTTGILDGKVYRTGEETEHFGIMIHTRDLDAEVAQQKGILVKDTLLQSVYRITVTVPESIAVDGTVIPSATYFIQALTQTSSVIPLGTETQDRWCTSSVNFTVTLWED